MRLEKPRTKRAGKYALALDLEELRKLFHVVNRSEQKTGVQYPGGRSDSLERFGEELARLLQAEILR